MMSLPPTFPVLMRRKTNAFMLLELLVSMVLIAIIATVSFSIMNATSSAWTAHKARISAFGDSRVIFEALTNRLSQATLNTYWDYDHRGEPKKYLRKSELQYIQGKASDLIPVVSGTTTSAVFFIAPLGIHENAAYKPLVKLLTACGFYVKFDGQPNRPAFVSDRIPQRYRYRLYQCIQPGEQLEIYSSSNDKKWFRDAAVDWSFPMADNVIGLILRAKYPDGEGEMIDYDYDSCSQPNLNVHSPTYNQLPPVISATLVIIDESSAKQLEAKYNDTPPPVLPPSTAFTDPSHYEQDMKDWQEQLNGFSPKINYRILTSDVSIKGAKWSND